VRFSFVKCHGSGNDFPLIDARAIDLPDTAWATVARVLSDRTGPVGSDGLLLLTDGDAAHAIGFRMFNPDGSEAETCLNGVRCVARAGFEALGVTQADMRLVSSSAYVARDADLAPDVYTVRETAGPVSLDVKAWPLDVGLDRIVDAVVPPLGTRRFTAVAIPNPHLVSFVDLIDDAELVRMGEVCEVSPAWLPNRANVSFCEVRPDALFVRTFERGVGLTNACGSAMASATYAACLTGRWRWDEPVTVLNRGGLVRAAAGEDGMVTLSGTATYEWAGEVDVDLATGTAGAVTVTQRYDDEIAAWDAVRAQASG
jgi:diaminopimelate epimerase